MDNENKNKFRIGNSFKIAPMTMLEKIPFRWNPKEYRIMKIDTEKGEIVLELIKQ